MKWTGYSDAHNSFVNILACGGSSASKVNVCEHGRSCLLLSVERLFTSTG